MYKKNNHNGSAILLAILILSAIIICTISLFRGISFFNQMSIAKQRYEQKYRLAEGILNLGILFCKQHYKKITALQKEGKDSFYIDTGFWNIENHLGFKGKVQVKIKNTSLQVKAVLVEKNKKTFEIGCTVLPAKVKNVEIKSKKPFVITKWRICST